MSRVVELNDDSEWAAVLRDSKGFGGKGLVVDFSATWCGPCQAIGPVFEKLSTQYPNIKFVKVDVDKLQGVAQECGVKAMPTFQAYFNGEQVEELVGADPSKLKAMIDKVDAMQGPGGSGQKALLLRLAQSNEAADSLSCGRRYRMRRFLQEDLPPKVAGARARATEAPLKDMKTVVVSCCCGDGYSTTPREIAEAGREAPNKQPVFTVETTLCRTNVKNHLHVKMASTMRVRSAPARAGLQARASRRSVVVVKAAEKRIVIGLAADSGCGKSTFMRRMTGIFGGAPKPPAGGNPDSNTLISDMTTVICLDDYHSLDRKGRSAAGVTALDPKAQFFDLMYEQVKALKDGKAVDKPIYNHVSGLLDPPEKIDPASILVIEGLHPFYDERVRDLLDFKIYLDISDEIKFAWKIQRDMAERGHSLDSIKKSIESRKPDFDAYIDPQKKHADMIIQVLPTQLVPDDEGKILRVRLIQKEGKKLFDPVYLFDEGSTVSWIPCGRKLTCSFPGIKFYYGPDTWYGEDVSVLEMDGQFDKLEELIYVESHLSNTSAKFYGEITQQMLKNSSFPGSNNGTGLLQTIIGLKVREVYERITSESVVPTSA